MSPVAWLQLLIFVFLAGVLLNFPWLIYFAVSVTLVMATAHFWRKHSLDQVQYTRRFHYTRGFPGEKTDVQLTIVNNKLLPIAWLRASDTWYSPVGPEEEGTLSPSYLPNQGFLINLYSLRWRERITRHYSLLFRKRGIYEIGPVQLQAGDLFGLYEKQQELTGTELLTVFPEILPLERLKLPAEDPFGDRKARKPLFEDPSQAMGIRPYQPEDGFRRIHWPASARSSELQVKVFQPVTARVLAICLDVTTEEHFWLGFSPEILEEMVKVCATLVYQGVEDGYSVGLFSNGCLAHADQPFRIQPGRSPKQLAVLLQALAGVTPFASAAFETFLIRSMADIPFGSTLVLVTARVPVTLQDTLLRLRRYRQHITIITLQEAAPPDLPGIRLIHLPFHPAEIVEAR
jgi:uncharacterized protein (DUF58 family)